MSRPLLPALLCVLALACDRQESFDEDELPPAPGAAAPADPGAAPPATDGSFPWTDRLARLPALGALAGHPVTDAAQGPWTLRTSAGGARVMGRGGALRSTGGADLDLGMAEGAAVAEIAEVALDASGGAARDLRMARTPVPTARREPAAAAAPLRAGSTDDNADLAAYRAFQDAQAPAFGAGVDRLDVSHPHLITVRGAEGRPVPGARVSVIDRATDTVVWSARSMGDGRVPVYPALLVPGEDGQASGLAGPEGWTVEVEAGPHRQLARWPAGQESLELRLDAPWTAAVGPEAGETVPVDVCFVIDTTGSMGDEIAQVKATLLQLSERLRREADGRVDLRYSAVLYRDIGDAYVTKSHPFTTDLAGFDAALQGIQANGGGDGPESLNQGLALAAGGMEWRENAAKVAFLIADAPPHMDYQDDVSYGRAAASALVQGIKVHTVAASGLDARGSLVFRQIAQLSRGHFIFIEYGSNAASAARHGLPGPTGSNNLDAILYGRIRAEIDGWGRDLTVLSRR